MNLKSFIEMMELFFCVIYNRKKETELLPKLRNKKEVTLKQRITKIDQPFVRSWISISL